MTLQLFRPVDLHGGSECNCFGVVIDDGDGGFEFHGTDGTVIEDVGVFDLDTTGHADWVECVPLPSSSAKDPGDRRGVLGADSRLIGEVWLDGEEWHVKYSLLKTAGWDENPPTFGSRDGAIGWVLDQDRPRIKALHEAKQAGS